MMTRIALVSVLGLVVAMGACSSSSDEEGASEAAQAIQSMEQADAEAVRACESEASSCVSENTGSEGEGACEGINAGCQELEAQLAQVREEAVACWGSVQECSGDRCEESASQCRALSDTVGEARGPVLECGQNARRCMHQAVSSSTEGAMELCGAVREACGKGVADASVSRVRAAAGEPIQTQSGDAEQSADSSGDGAAAGEGSAAGAADGATGEAPADGSGDGAAGSGSTAEQEQTVEHTDNAASETSMSGMEARQQECLSQVQSCCEAASDPAADPARLRQGGNACALAACAAE